jgi:hypothetical protein
MSILRSAVGLLESFLDMAEEQASRWLASRTMPEYFRKLLFISLHVTLHAYNIFTASNFSYAECPSLCSLLSVQFFQAVRILNAVVLLNPTTTSRAIFSCAQCAPPNPNHLSSNPLSSSYESQFSTTTAASSYPSKVDITVDIIGW